MRTLRPRNKLADAKIRRFPFNSVQAPAQVVAGEHMRILDLGCGTGVGLEPWGVSDADKITGLDIDAGRLAVAKIRFPEQDFLTRRWGALALQKLKL